MINFFSLGWGAFFLHKSRSKCATWMKLYNILVEAFIKMCTNFLLIVTNIVYFTDQNFIILLKIRHFLLKSDLKFILSTEYSEKICKNHFPIKFSVNCDHLKVLVSFGFLFHSLQTNNLDICKKLYDLCFCFSKSIILYFFLFSDR